MRRTSRKLDPFPQYVNPLLPLLLLTSPLSFLLSSFLSTSLIPYASLVNLLGMKVQDFWDFYVHLVRANDLPNTSDYHLFKDGIKPMWEVNLSLSHLLPHLYLFYYSRQLRLFILNLLFITIHYSHAFTSRYIYLTPLFHNHYSDHGSILTTTTG